LSQEAEVKNLFIIMKKTYPVSGMHCTSCETLLQKEIMEIPNVKSAKASFAKGTLTVESAKEIPQEKIQKTIEKCGYKREEKKADPKKTWSYYAQIALIAVVFLVIFWSLSYIDITPILSRYIARNRLWHCVLARYRGFGLYLFSPYRWARDEFFE
jgi:cation transport ATPase